MNSPPLIVVHRDDQSATSDELDENPRDLDAVIQVVRHVKAEITKEDIFTLRRGVGLGLVVDEQHEEL